MKATPSTLPARSYFFGFLLGMVLCGFFIWQSVFSLTGIPNYSSVLVGNLLKFKKDAARRIDQPKVLICGGSSALFGIRGDVITRQTGWPAVNLGLLAALGIPTPCRWVQELGRPGDVVILAFEYELYDWADFNLVDSPRSVQSYRYNMIYVEYLLAYEPEYFRQMDLMDQCKVVVNLSNSEIFDGIKDRWRHQYLHVPFPVYETTAFCNSNGDAVTATQNNRPANAHRDGKAGPLLYGFTPHPAGFDYLRGFVRWCNAHQITVLATWPNLLDCPEYHTPRAQEAVKRVVNFYHSIGVPILGDYEESLLPFEQFWDTNYHLTSQDAEARTVRLLKHWPPELAHATAP